MNTLEIAKNTPTPSTDWERALEAQVLELQQKLARVRQWEKLLRTGLLKLSQSDDMTRMDWRGARLLLESIYRICCFL